MNRKIMPFMLFIIEAVMYYFICLYFHMDIDLIVGSGILYFYSYLYTALFFKYMSYLG